MKIRTKILLILALIITTTCVNFLIYNYFTKQQTISASRSVMKIIEKKSDLIVSRFFIEHIIDETVKKDLFGVDFLMPDDKVLITLSATVNACIKLDQIKPEDIAETSDSVKISIPKPVLCENPNIDLSSLKEHLKSGFGKEALEQKVLNKVQDNIIKEITEKNYLENYANPLGKEVLKDFLGNIVKDKQLIIEYK